MGGVRAETDKGTRGGLVLEWRCQGQHNKRPCGKLLGLVRYFAGEVEIRCPRCKSLNLFRLPFNGGD